MKFLAIILLLPALFLEVSVTTIPVIFLVLLCLTVILRANWLFVLAFVFGLLFDLLSFKTLGISSAFLTAFLFLVLLYQSKFEITTGYFVFTTSFVGSLLFLLLQGYSNAIILQAILSSIIGLLLFKLIQKFSQSLATSSN
jgi:cell shape-determining protein MreD